MAGIYGRSTLRALDTIISRLRKRLKNVSPADSQEGELIQTVYGIGYMLKPGIRPAR
jgi:two-component system OmpR family response regulator